MSTNQDSIVAVAEKMRREKQARARSILIQLGIFVLLPTLLATAYFGFLASPRFDSKMLIAVRAGVSTGADVTSDPTKDAAEISDYAESHDSLRAVGEAIDLDRVYSSPEIDRLSRLSPSAGSESRNRYWVSHVDVRMDDRSGHLKITVTAYDPNDAHEVAAALLDHLEERVGRLHAQAREDALDSAQTAVKDARDDLVEARLALAKSRPPTPAIGEAPAPPTREFAAAELDLSLAETQYENAVHELSDTRRANLATRRYVEVVAPPSQPDQPTGPLRLRTIVTAFLVSLAVYAIGSLLLASIREHARL